MIVALALFWVVTTITVATVYTYMILKNDEKFDRETSLVIGLSMLFSPLTLVAILAVMWYCVRERDWKIKASVIYCNWEGAAKLKAFKTSHSFDWNRDPKRFEYMRDTVRELSDKDLDFLCTVNKNVYELEKDVRDCLLDEMLERKIIKA